MLESYSMLILPEGSVCNDINHRLMLAVNKKINLPHISLGRPFQSSDESIENNLRDYFGNRQAFRVNLDEIRCFDNGAIYLTTSSYSENQNIKQMYFDITTRFGNNPNSSSDFVPHLTLMYKGSIKDKPSLLIDTLKKHFDKAIPVKIEIIKVTKSLNKGRWTDLNYFCLEDESENMSIKNGVIMRPIYQTN